MSEKTELAVKEVSPAFESEQVVLASQVEQSRLALLKSLLRVQPVAARIASELHAGLQQGSDGSEIILVKSSDEYRELLQDFMDLYSLYQQSARQNDVADLTEKAVQSRETVQLYRCDLSKGNSDALIVAMIEAIEKLHFLPVYLIGVSDALMRQADFVSDLDDGVVKEIKQGRNRLHRLRQDMISSNTGLVAFVAHKYKTVSLSFEDLMQEGMVGLIKAVDRFDPDRGICFSTYAIYWIRQAISRLIVKQDKVVPLPVALAEKASAVFEAMRVCYLEKERWPTLEELKACCDLTEQEIKTISSYYQATHTLDNRTDDEEDGVDELSKMQQQQFALPLDQLIDRDFADYVDKAVATLPEKQATILTMRFGLKNHAEMTLQAVADHLHVTRERVRQIQNEALTKLKQQFGFDLMLFLEPNDT